MGSDGLPEVGDSIGRRRGGGVLGMRDMSAGVVVGGS